jgi:hypothetical protein
VIRPIISITVPFIKNKAEYRTETIPVPNPYGSNGLIETAVIKKIIGDNSINTTPDKILFFLFFADTLNAIKFDIPKANTIIIKNNASKKPPPYKLIKNKRFSTSTLDICYTTT